MSRWVFALWFCAAVCMASPQEPKQPPKTPPPQEQPPPEPPPPEEDESLKAKEYSFNPLQADKELKVGNYYFKLGKYKAAALRFEEATKWNTNLAEAWLRLGEVQEKRHDSTAAKQAYAKYLELSPDAKDTAEIRKKMAKLH
jgi:tetratricopeptide (TPR) repeat protein